MNIRDYIMHEILTMEPGREVFYGEVWVKNDKIAYVAEQKRTCGGMGQIPVPQELRGISNWIARETF